MKKNNYKCIAIIRIDKYGQMNAKPLNHKIKDNIKIVNFHQNAENGTLAVIKIKKDKTAEIIKIFQQEQNQQRKGIIIRENNNISIHPIDWKKNLRAIIDNRDKQQYLTGDVVYYSVEKNRQQKTLQQKTLQQKTLQVRIIKKINHIKFAKNQTRPDKYLDIAIQQYDLNKDFSKEAMNYCRNITIPKKTSHQDKTDIEFITIDPQNAKDHDDAVCAEIKNYGYTIYVAIADVAYFVKKSDPIDQEAREKAFSIYFPNFVIPMLPEKISQNICSLKNDCDKLTILCTIDIDKNGTIIKFQFDKAKIRVKNNITYQQAQDIFENKQKSKLKTQIDIIFEAWKALDKAKKIRQPLDISIDEITLDINPEQKINEIIINKRLEAHQVIEEFMIAANICASKFICENKRQTLHRIHPEAEAEKIERITELVNSPHFHSLGDTNAQKSKTKKTHKYKIGHKPKPTQFNAIIQSQNSQLKKQIIARIVIQAQAKACYSDENIGHYGLQIKNYTHFTSPIRRYADLTIHRIITDIIDNNKTNNHNDDLEYLAKHLSEAEIIAMKAERDTVSRILIAYHAEDIENIYDAYVVGINNAGIFVKIEKTSAEAFIPKSQLPIKLNRKNKYQRYKNKYQNRNNIQQDSIQQEILKAFPIGKYLKVKVIEANPISNNLVCKIV